jgi:hypothetical protein
MSDGGDMPFKRVGMAAIGMIKEVMNQSDILLS